MTRYLIDALDLGHNAKGITRVLSSLIPRVIERSNAEIVIACTVAGASQLDPLSLERAHQVPRRLQSKWEQWDLPRLGTHLGVDAIYSHRECGPLWGPALVLHVPEDPEVRWERHPPRSPREHLRRLYSRSLLRRSLFRAEVVATSTTAGARQLCARYSIPEGSISVIPLGVDLDIFRPAAWPSADAVFHLGSSDPRDRAVTVVEAWAAARENAPSLPRLVIAGALGHQEAAVRQRAAELRVNVELPGRLTDDELSARFRNAAVVVQPSSDEGFGLQPLEALASAAPLVVTYAAAVTEVVGDAAIIRPGDTLEIAEGILAALERAESLRPAARRRAEEFSWDASADAVLARLEAACSRATRTR